MKPTDWYNTFKLVTPVLMRVLEDRHTGGNKTQLVLKQRPNVAEELIAAILLLEETDPQLVRAVRHDIEHDYCQLSDECQYCDTTGKFAL